MAMEIQNLRALRAVARERGFSAAARALHRTQPTVSMQIRRLEEELGEQLFERKGKEVSLTPAGEYLLPRAEEALRAWEDLASAVTDFRGLRRGSLQIGTTDVASIYVLPRAYRRFLRAHPEVELSVAVEGTAPLLQALRTGLIELAVATLPVSGDDLEIRVVEKDALLPVLHRRHPLASRKRIRLGELCETPMITFKGDSVTRREVARVFAAQNLSPRIGMEISSPEAIKKLVEVGLGFAILPERSVRAEIRAGILASPAVVGVTMERRIGVVTVEGRYLSPAAKAFLSLVGGAS
jgi:DNA-binding transcriptional LysR family regulator